MSEKMKLYSMFEHPEQKGNETGKENAPVRAWEYDDKGNRVLKVIGETNRYAKIQEFAEETQIHNIIAKAIIDPTVLNQREGFYGDITLYPQTPGEALNTIAAIKNEFSQLDEETRAKFGNNPEQYIMQYGTKEFAEKMGLTQEETKAALAATEQKGEIINEPEQ